MALRCHIHSQINCLHFRSERSARYLSEAYRERKVEKTYWSVVIGSPGHEQGDISIPLKEHTVNGRFKITLSGDETLDGNVSDIELIYRNTETY